ncbi:MAG: heat-inducible transcription repressor HrcA [Eubacterium sp.]|nr:heat-inducible transcription repressor HrcA [Eubacterium sp.]
MELDNRKRTILTAIIQTYLETGEPVGSRTISKYTDLNLSSATIRNEMSDLEEMGYIIQPHTSAGRVPTDLGYRLYVDELIKAKNQEVADMKEMMIKKTDRLEKMLRQVVRVLASNTNYASMITGPVYHQNKLKFIQLSKVRDNQLLAVIVAEGNMVTNRIINTAEPLDDESVLKLNLMLNNTLIGHSIEEISLEMIRAMKEQAGIHSSLIGDVVDAVAEAIKPDKEELPVYTSGANNIFRYPELSDSEKAGELISAFEEKYELAEMLMGSLEEKNEDDIQVFIGSEASISTMKDCSMVTTTYTIGPGMKGTIAIIGPKRMNYENVVDNLKTLRAQMDKIFGGNNVEQLEDKNTKSGGETT